MSSEEHIQVYQKTGDAAELRLAANAIDRQKAAKGKLELWLALLDTVDSAKDPNFDPEDVPAARVTIPPGTRLKPGFPMPAPEAIADPADRQKYDDAVAANNSKTLAYRVQYDLLRMDQELTLRADAYIRRVFPKSEQSIEELNRAMAGRIHNAGRAAHLRLLVTP